MRINGGCEDVVRVLGLELGREFKQFRVVADAIGEDDRTEDRCQGRYGRRMELQNDVKTIESVDC